MPSRRQVLQGIFGLTILGVTGSRGRALAGPHPSAKAVSGTGGQPIRWALPASAYANLANPTLGGDAGVCKRAFGDGSTWFAGRVTGRCPIPAGLTGIGVATFTAYSNGLDGFLDITRSGPLPGWASAVRYDPEAWTATPEVEQGAWLHNAYAGVSFAALFAELAHSLGLRVILTPGTDLCNNLTNSAYPGASPQYPLDGRTEPSAFVGYNMASAAQWLGTADIFQFQSQCVEASAANGATTAVLASTVAAVSDQTRVGSAPLFAGLGRTGAEWDGASATDLYDSISTATSVGAKGFWINVDADRSRVSAMIGALRLAGY